ncbi:MAG: hypothetical protein H6606_11035 [Flavobacteriales bacterium]|nr:hypothetical protein [Flavobacteriales bacterium]
MSSSNKKKKVKVKKQATPRPQAPEPVKRDKLYMASSVVVVVLFLFIWGQWYKPEVKDPWQQGVELVDSAQKTQDSVQRNDLFDQAREKLNEQVRLHPYHARLWLQKGYYHFRRQDWDSCILCQKKAIELGAGGMINAIEFDAASIMVSALTQKIQKEGMDSTQIFALADSCEVDNFENAKLYWLRGVVYNQYRNFPEARKWLEQAYKLQPRDFDNAYNYGYSLAMLGERDQALTVLRQAAALQPNNQNVQNLINNLTAQTGN